VAVDKGYWGAVEACAGDSDTLDQVVLRGHAMSVVYSPSYHRFNSCADLERARHQFATAMLTGLQLAAHRRGTQLGPMLLPAVSCAQSR